MRTETPTGVQATEHTGTEESRGNYRLERLDGVEITTGTEKHTFDKPTVIFQGNHTRKAKTV